MTVGWRGEQGGEGEIDAINDTNKKPTLPIPPCFFSVELVFLASRLNIPLAEVAVNWAEVPGSKIRVTSIIHMALEMAAIAVGYGTGVWRAAGEGELARVRGGGAAA